MGKRHVIADRRLEIAAGIAAFLGGAWLLHDAYERRGVDVPRLFRPFTFW